MVGGAATAGSARCRGIACFLRQKRANERKYAFYKHDFSKKRLQLWRAREVHKIGFGARVFMPELIGVGGV